MQKIFLFLAVSLCSVVIATAAPANLVKNPGFEGKPTIATKSGDQWWFSEGAGKLDNKVDQETAHTGKASVRLQSDTNTKGVIVSPSFAVTGGDELSFEAWVKVSDVGTNTEIGRAGIAFRRKGGNVMERNYFHATAKAGEWTLISGTVKAPAEAITAEVHLGYTNAPATLWYDDVVATVTSPISFSLVESAKPWAGPQEITVRVANHQSSQFTGTVSCTIGKVATKLPVTLPAGATHDFKLPITLIGIKQHEYKIALLETTNEAAPLRLLQGKFRATSPLGLFPACPCYQIVGQGNGDTRIDARVNVNPKQRAGLKLVVEAADATGKVIQSANTSAVKGDFTGLNLRLPVDKPTVFAITARLLNSAGKEIASEKTDVHVAATNEAQVVLGPDGFLRIDGLPNFPIGIYNSGHEEEMGKAGFTSTHNYEITTGEADDAINQNETDLKAMLDKSWANGMRMMVEVPRKSVEKAKWAQVRRRVETFKNHPGLLCWGSEERVARGNAPLKNVTALYKLLHELDPNHPLVLGDTRDVIEKFKVDRRDFFPDDSMDIGIWWWYPIPLKEPDGNGVDAANTSDLMDPPSWLVTTHSKKPLWIAIQAYQKPAKDARFPTPEEYRCQSYLSVINGVKGIFFYVGSGQRDAQGKPAGLLNKLEEAHWTYVQKLAGELHTFSPVIMSPKAAAEVTLSPANAPVEFTTRQSDGKSYVIAANKSAKPQKVTFGSALFKGVKIHVLDEEHPVTVEGDSLADDFVGFGVHVYEVEPAK